MEDQKQRTHSLKPRREERKGREGWEGGNQEREIENGKIWKEEGNK